MTDPANAASREARGHNIKCWPNVFSEMLAGRKTAEFRYNDRDYRTGDSLLIREWDTATGAYTHREITRRITHVLSGGFGMPAGYAMLSLVDENVSLLATLERGSLAALHKLQHDGTTPAAKPRWGASIIAWAAEEIQALRAALHDTAPTDQAQGGEVERLRAEIARRDANEARNCVNWGPCSRHDGRMSDAAQSNPTDGGMAS